jgi:nucleotide-binding universal stress UspA family protein
MNVLVYFDGVQQRSAQRTVALLGEKFIFDLDLISHTPIANQALWSKNLRGVLQEKRAEGPFEQAVAKACAAKRYDLVIAAPNDRRGLVRMILGSRIGRFVSAAPATIWVPRGDQINLRRIVVGISEQDARLAARLAQAYDAKLELVYVVSQLPLFYTTFSEFHEALENDAKIALMAPGVVELRRIYNLLKDEGVRVELIIRSGTVADELVTVCNGDGKKPQADLLVIGAHAPGLYARADYLENLAEEIVESAPCPTLVVHAKSEWAEWKIVEHDRA